MTELIAPFKKATLNPILKSFWRTPARIRVLHGGRASSKSWDAAGNAIMMAYFCRVKFLCVRQFQNNINESVYTLLKVQIERFGLQRHFKITNNRIFCTKTGSEFVFYGLWRNIGEIKSFEGADILWVEEAHGLTQEQWEILDPTIRKEHSQIWIIFNPRFTHDFVYENFILTPQPDSIIRQINYDENQFLSETMKKVILAAIGKPWFNHVYLGHPRDGDQFFALENLLVDGFGVVNTLPVDYVYAVIDTAIKTGKKHDGTGVTYFARTKSWGHPLLILDWDIQQIEGASLEKWLPSVYEKLEQLSREHQALMGSAGAFIEDKASGIILLQQAKTHGWNATPIDGQLTSVGKDERALNVSGHVFQGKVKLTKHAHEKTVEYKGVRRNHFISQVVGFRIGDEEAYKRPDDLLDTATYGIAIGLGNSDGF